jgi:hypothetical protein
LQLEHSKDVVAQAQAVVGLSGQLTHSPAMFLCNRWLLQPQHSKDVVASAPTAVQL